MNKAKLELGFKALKYALLLAAAAWLGLAGNIIPILWDESRLAAAHCTVLSLLALTLIVWANKPQLKRTR